MSKKKIIAIAICAVVIIGAAVAAVPIVRHFTATEEPTTQTTTQPSYEYPTYVPVNNNDVEEPSTEDANIATTIQQIAQITKNTANGNKMPSGGNKTPATTKKATQNNNNKNNSGNKGNGGLVDNAIGQDDS